MYEQSRMHKDVKIMDIYSKIFRRSLFIINSPHVIEFNRFPWTAESWPEAIVTHPSVRGSSSSKVTSRLRPRPGCGCYFTYPLPRKQKKRKNESYFDCILQTQFRGFFNVKVTHTTIAQKWQLSLRRFMKYWCFFCEYRLSVTLKLDRLRY